MVDKPWRKIFKINDTKTFKQLMSGITNRTELKVPKMEIKC